MVSSVNNDYTLNNVSEIRNEEAMKFFYIVPL